jgi:hypothetical protein
MALLLSVLPCFAFRAVAELRESAAKNRRRQIIGYSGPAPVDEDQPVASSPGIKLHRMVNSKEVERAGALQALRDFAQSLGVPVEAANATYDRELQALRNGAKVDRFVVVIAQKRTRDALRDVAGALRQR